MKATCCRSAPRCATCPVVLAARARRRLNSPEVADALVTEILAGVPPRKLPPCVQQALGSLDERRFSRVPASV